MRVADVKVPQGLGDIFWCYRKLYDYFDVINFKIYVTSDTNTIEMRSMGLFEGFPKVGKVEPEVAVAQLVYGLPKKIIRLDDILPNMAPREDGVYEFEYIVNRWLELGNYLEDIDEQHKVAWDIELPQKEVSGLPEKYILLYISGDTRKLKNTVWMLSDWARFVAKFREKYDYPVVLVGASFDSWVQEKIVPLLKMRNIPIQTVTDLSAPELCYVVDKAEWLVGYQSGISILADALDTRQLMVYFNVLDKMKDSWVKPENRTNGMFNYCWFGNPVQDALKIVGC